MSQIVKYYVSAHTASEFVRYLESNLASIENVFMLKHSSRRVISDVLKELQKRFDGKGRQEICCSSFRKNDIEGILLRDMSVGIVADYLVKDKRISTTTIDLHAWFPMNVNKMKEKKASALQADAYTHFAKGLSIHDELENIYIKEMDFTEANRVTNTLIAQMFRNSSESAKVPRIYERLFGTNTMDGVVNVVPQLIEPLQHRIFIKGRAGTGKSVLMKKVVEQSKRHGYDTEVYRCSFDPNSIDMVVIRALDYCLFDSTAPHEFFPNRKTDQIIDLYEMTVTAGTDEKYKDKIQHTTKAYKAEMKQGLHCLNDMRTYEPVLNVGEKKYHDTIVAMSNDIFKKI